MFVIKFELEKCCFKIGGPFKTPVLPYTFELSLILKSNSIGILKGMAQFQRHSNWKAKNNSGS